MLKKIFIFIILTLLPTYAICGKYGIPNDNQVLRQWGQVEKSEINSNFKLLVWNIYKTRHADFYKTFTYFSENFDLLLLQESYLNDLSLAYFSTLTDFEFYFAESFHYKKINNNPTGVMTASKAIPKNIFFKRSPYTENFIKTPKTTLFTKYSIKNSTKELLVANIHGLNFVSKKKYYAQMDQINKTFKNHKGPIIFAGDFNPKSKKKFNYLKNITISLGLQEVTFARDYRTRTKLKGRTLDYIFIRGIKYSNSKVWKNYIGSDHKAISIEAEIIK